MFSIETTVERNERKAKRVLMEAAKEAALRTVEEKLVELQDMSNEDDDVGIVHAGMISGLILSCEQNLKSIRPLIKV